MATAEITVMGAGIFGLAIAYACARRGARVQVIEASAVGAGSSGGLIGALAPHTPGQWNVKKQFQLDSLLMAEDFWAGVADLAGVSPGYARTGRLQPLLDDKAVAMARTREGEAKILWQDHASWQVVAQADLSDWAPHSPTGLLVHDTLSARIDPRAALTALSGAIAALGGKIHLGQGQAEGQVIWATGAAGLADLSAHFGRDIGIGQKGQAALLAYEVAALPQIYADGLHIVPHDGGHVAIGSTSEREYTDASATDAQLEQLIDRARIICPQLAHAPVVARWAGLRPRASTRRPVLGAWPGRPGHYIANGGFKIGFGIAPKVADCMADLVLNGSAQIPEAFDPAGL